MNYIVLIADIIKSKEIDNRDKLQSELQNKLDEISNNSKGLLSPFTITLGDEFQAVYNKGQYLLKDIFNILVKIYPVSIRFSIGWGEITTDINKKSSIGMDGEAFYNARDGLDRLKKVDYSIIQFYGDLFKSTEFINKSLSLSLSIMSDWKANTWFIFNQLMHNKPVKKIAPKLNITERGVYKIIDTNRIRNFVEYFNSLEKELIKSINK